MARTRKRSAFDLSHVRSVSAWALWFDGKPAGKIVANWSDNPAGSVCTATVAIWDGPCKELEKTTASAGGYGYDKLSACLASILNPIFQSTPNGFKYLDGGSSQVHGWLESVGYSVLEVI